MFDKVVFAGGGHRCWWQAGFWDAVTRQIELRPRVIAGVSVGAATACLLHAGDSQRALAYYERALAGRLLNVDLTSLWHRDRPFFPHADIQRKALRALLGDEHFRELQWTAPEIRVVVARLPIGMGPRSAALRGMLAYQREKHVDQPLHPKAGREMGFTAEWRRVQECRNVRELVDLLMASSASPPFTPLGDLDDEPCMDGGMVDDVPVDAVADVPGTTLVLTTRRYRGRGDIFVHDGRMYVQPSQPIDVRAWDYTSPRRYRRVYDHGWNDGLAFLRTFALGHAAQAGAEVVEVAEVAEVRAETQAEQQSEEKSKHPTTVGPTQRAADAPDGDAPRESPKSGVSERIDAAPMAVDDDDAFGREADAALHAMAPVAARATAPVDGGVANADARDATVPVATQDDDIDEDAMRGMRLRDLAARAPDAAGSGGMPGMPGTTTDPHDLSARQQHAEQEAAARALAERLAAEQARELDADRAAFKREWLQRRRAEGRLDPAPVARFHDGPGAGELHAELGLEATLSSGHESTAAASGDEAASRKFAPGAAGPPRSPRPPGLHGVTRGVRGLGAPDVNGPSTRH